MTKNTESQTNMDPTRIRSIFSENLLELARPYRSIAALSDGLGINRTQFNRYIAGNSFPRPDVLQRICAFFDTDARILTTPLDQIRKPNRSLDALGAAFFGNTGLEVGTDDLPNGFYCLVRRSFLFPGKFMRNVAFVRRHDTYPILRIVDSKTALARMGMSDLIGNRAFCGPVARHGNGFAALLGLSNGQSMSFQFFAPSDVPGHRMWEGFAAAPIRERRSAERVSRILYEFIPGGVAAALPIARNDELIAANDLTPLERSFMRPGDPFT